MKQNQTTQTGTGKEKTQQWNPQQQNQQRPGSASTQGGLNRQQGGKTTINPKDTTKGGRTDTDTGTGTASGGGKPF